MSMTVEHTWDTEVMLQLLSPERMSTYLSHSDHCLDQAFDTYRENMRLAGTLQTVTAMVEVITRNAIDHALTDWINTHGSVSDWFDLSLFDQHATQVIATARQRATRIHTTPSHADVIAELSFGFWRFLTSKRYLTTLWTPALQYAFPYGHEDVWTRQKQVSQIMSNMVFIRNRAAHLEPVFKRNITHDVEQARTLMSWIAPDAALWFTDMLHD